MRRLAIVAALLLAACGSPTPDGSARSARDVIVAADAAPGSVAESNWRRFANNVGVWAPGVSLTLRLGTEAGPPAARVTDLAQGAVQVASLPPDIATELVPELGILSAPGLFDSQDEADHILDTILLEPYRRLFMDKGLVLLDWIDDGWAGPPAQHVYGTGVIVANKAWFERLTPHDRDVFQQAYGSAGQARADRRAAGAGLGAAVTDGAPAGTAAQWSEATRETHQAIVIRAGGHGQEIYDLAVSAKRAFAASDKAAPGG